MAKKLSSVLCVLKVFLSNLLVGDIGEKLARKLALCL